MLPLEHRAVAGWGCAEALDGKGSGASGGEGVRREAGGTAFGVEDFDPVSKEGGRVDGEGQGKSVDGLAGAGLDLESLDRGAGCRGWVGDAADGCCHRAFDGDAVGGLFGGGPVELDLVADAAGREIFDGLRKIEGGRARLAGAGTSGGADDEKRSAEGREPS